MTFTVQLAQKATPENHCDSVYLLKTHVWQPGEGGLGGESNQGG